MEFRALSVQRKNSSPHTKTFNLDNTGPVRDFVLSDLCNSMGEKKVGGWWMWRREERGEGVGEGCLLLVLMQKALTLLC